MTKSSAAKSRYIFDASPIILLLEKCRLKTQLSQFAERNELCAPIRVFEEFNIGDTENPEPDAIGFQKIFHVLKVPLEEDLLPFFHFDSTSGEIWVISYAIRHSEFCCVIDEEFGRNICKLFKVKLTGTLSIIAEMKELEILGMGDLRQIRSTIRKSGFYLSTELLHKLDEICSR